MDTWQVLHRAQRGWTTEALVFVLYVALAVGAVLSQYLKTAAHPGDVYPEYNGYLILKSTFGHLITHQNLYDWYLKEHWICISTVRHLRYSSRRWHGCRTGLAWACGTSSMLHHCSLLSNLCLACG